MSNMPSSYKYTMTVRFIRAEDVTGSGKNDDRAVITGVDDDVYQLTYHFGDCKKKPVVKEAVLDTMGVLRWFNRTLRFVDADYVPFARYQFDFSLMPSIMIAHQELHHHHKVILSAVKFHLENWMSEDDFYHEETLDADEVQHPNEFIPFDEDEDDYDFKNVNDVTKYDIEDDYSSISSEEYVPPAPVNKHQFFDENEGAVKKMIQRMEQKSKKHTSH
jgi:hypothetical protein